MQEANRPLDYDVAGEEHFFPAGTDMHRHVAWRVTGGVEGGHARRHLRSGLDQAQARAGQFQIRLGNQRLLLGGHFAGQFGVAPEGDLSLAGDEFGRGEQQRRVLAVTDTPEVGEMAVSERDLVYIARGYPALARLPSNLPFVFWNLSTPQPASINTNLSPVLTRMVLICSPTGLDGWNVDVSRPLASSARSPHSVSAGNASVPSLTTVISMVPSLKR